MNKRRNGEYYENLACDHVRDNGGVITERNFRSRAGEIDIIFKDGRYLVFAEVKYRSGLRFGTAENAVDYKKQQTICRVSDFYRKKYHIPENTPLRYDVIAISLDKNGNTVFRWHKNAFEYIPKKGRNPF